ncbi:MAG: threonine synthase [SAR86 cluster bacterium]|uniref:Threonine synthase n=1 Tax=SAR86 cluster bacterium TaxID=2030880 RepID=A0A2A5CC37_9GAMM|nr:threonine synthase [bacterium AH-315-I11]PCJ41464.1 MAG: threonine synthase [SAR86 cluster bacterium]
MKYISTRGQCEPHSFEEVVLTGLAPDGGLFIPETVPQLSGEQILSWKNLSYADLAYEIIRLYVDGAVEDDVLKQMVTDTYAEFSHPEVAPLHELGDNEWVLELFHGPTLAFKDFALQLLGRLLDYFLEKRQQHVAILGATSGDTGSAALEGCKHSKFVDIFILHPHNLVSEVQRKQMTTVAGNNVHNIAISGNFDDCQQLVKQAFSDQSFLPDGYQLAAVNSINWARIMAQIVYYFYAALKFLDKNEAVSFSVPTGNFGDIYAGYLAKKMGLPIDQLIIATNKNDILHRFVSQNQYNLRGLEASLSPSMDIMVSSNFERFIFDMFKGDADKVTAFVTGLSKELNQVSEDEWAFAKANFDSASINDEETCAVIKEVSDKYGYLLDPHTAIGVRAAQLCKRNSDIPMISLATAHPVKFTEAIERAGLEAPALPDHLADLLERDESYVVLPQDLTDVKSYIVKSL